MPVSDARRRANKEYNAKAYDQILLRVKKAQKQVIQTHADSCGERMAAFITRAIQETMERDAQKSKNLQGTHFAPLRYDI